MLLRRFAIAATLAAVLAASRAHAAVQNSLVLNEANAVSGSNYLEDAGTVDATFGRVQGNGQNWFELLVVQGDALPGGGFANTLNIQNWTFNWRYDNTATDFGFGSVKFKPIPLWGAVPVGTLIAVSEHKEAWYHETATGSEIFQRDGDIDGLGNQDGPNFVAGPGKKKLEFHSDTQWNPNLTAGPDWTIRVWAGDLNQDSTFKYFDFDGEIHDGGNVDDVGAEAGGLFTVNNDSWQWTIKDAGGATIQGPGGEDQPGNQFNVNSREIIRLENFAASVATKQRYLDVTNGDYRAGSSSHYGLPNVWSGSSIPQDLSPLRNWLTPGDITLDGKVTGSDFLAWQRGFGVGTKASLNEGDLTGDGAVTSADLSAWASQLGVPVAAAVPEPAAASLASLAAAAAAYSQSARRRRR